MSRHLILRVDIYVHRAKSASARAGKTCPVRHAAATARFASFRRVELRLCAGARGEAKSQISTQKQTASTTTRRKTSRQLEKLDSVPKLLVTWTPA